MFIGIHILVFLFLGVQVAIVADHPLFLWEISAHLHVHISNFVCILACLKSSSTIFVIKKTSFHWSLFLKILLSYIISQQQFHLPQLHSTSSSPLDTHLLHFPQKSRLLKDINGHSIKSYNKLGTNTHSKAGLGNPVWRKGSQKKAKRVQILPTRPLLSIPQEHKVKYP